MLSLVAFLQSRERLNKKILQSRLDLTLKYLKRSDWVRLLVERVNTALDDDGCRTNGDCGIRFKSADRNLVTLVI